MAKAAAGYSDAVFWLHLVVNLLKCMPGGWCPKSEESFSKARDLAKEQKKSRAIIFIDEIEVLGGKRGSHSAHLEYDQTLNQLLVEMDGMHNRTDIQLLLIAATNRPDLLDNALLRPGRFDRQVRVDLPDKEERLTILELHCANKPLDKKNRFDGNCRQYLWLSGGHIWKM